MRLTVTQVAELAGCTRAYVKKQIADHVLKAVKNATNAWEIEQSEYERWNAARKRKRPIGS